MAADVFACSPRRPRGRARPAPLRPPPPDDDDSEPDEAPGRAPASDAPPPPPPPPPPRRQQIIHSGHFMVSSPHREHPPKKGYDFDTVNEQTCQTYSFGKTSSCHLSIDASLTKLFECMTLAYSGKLVSPKWKNFKGLKLQWRDKIRLNNAIWRAWYMQYLEKRKNPVCHFVTPLDGSVDVDEHRRPEAITTEGKYWRSRIEIVIREYHKWRTYFKKRLQQHKDEDLSSLAQDDDMLCWPKHGDGWKTPVPMEEDPLLDTDMLMSEFSDTLFSTLASHQPVAWPNPREIAHLGNADMIQPGLIPLQPNLDFMDTFEPFQDLFSSSRSIFGSMLPAPASTSVPDPSSPPAQESVLPAVGLPDSLIAAPTDTTLDPPERQSSGHAPQPEEPFLQASDFGAPVAPLSTAPSFMPVFPLPLLSPSPAPAPAVPPAFLQTQKFAGVGTSPSVITHTASATLTHDASAASFGQRPGLVIAARQAAPSPAPCALALSPAPRPPTVGPPQPQLTFVHPKPMSLTGGRPKQPPKIVPAPKPEPVSLVLKSACLAPAAFSGHPRAVIMTSGPLKREAVLAAPVSQPSVVLTPATIARAPGVAEFHGGILVTELGPSPGGPRLFSPGTVQDPLVKGEQAPVAGPSRDCTGPGQASPCALEQSPGPQSPQNSCVGKAAEPKNVTALKNRQMKHISAEQKRRFNIKMAFDTLNSLMSNNSKLTSNPITLQKTVEHITKLQQERSQLQEEARRLREEIEELNATILSCQQQLPATGVPVTWRQFDHMKDMFDEYVKSRTLQNWKFWIFSFIIQPLFESFKGSVSGSSLDELHRSALSWLEQRCSLPVLRPTVLSTLRHLSTTTSILTEPSLLPEQAAEAVTRIGRKSGES
ncbi:MLX-interacting protein [Sorex fumeus]|uniref:MLX-interacting protein n=1 Tax=Sorex fumeus TaxID=62283 RepID=UPI0024ACD0ED|nr:MLX-interacting protein [Sorex fumeus]